ncbi:MAG TPA: site-2 protease family protein [Ruminiclostridium sp.]|nr:site-2 protease family protein [Ruminiclostridium sp.]
MGTLLSLIQSRITDILYTALILIIAFPVHEIAHAYTAYKLGDPTAKNQGRFSLNPLKHLDPLGTICILLFQFGWAKPVPVNPNNFKNRKGGMAVTAISGPLSNLILAFISIILRFVLALAGSGMNANLYNTVDTFLDYSAQINIGLCIFNLLPLPPLDGSDILLFFLPERVGDFFYRYAMYFQILLFVLIATPIFSKPLSFLVNNVYNNLFSIVNLFFSPFMG